MLKHLVPECYIDSALVLALVKSNYKDELNHKHGCFNVERELIVGRLNDKFGVGIIDRDKQTVKYLSKFIEIARADFEQEMESPALILWRHNEEKINHYFIQICPAIEQWILNICGERKINLEEFELPLQLNDLKRITKKQSSIYDERFIALFKKMKETKHIAMQRLEKWLKILIEKNYNIDINELKNG